MDLNNIPNIKGIYKITNTDSKFFYIGSSQNIRIRIREHFYKLRKQTHNNKHLQRVFNLHGDSIFNIEVLENCENKSNEDLLDIEQTYLDSITDWKLCYNQTRSTRAFGKISEDEPHRKIKKKQQTLGKNNPFYGKTHSEENKTLMIESRRKRGDSAYRKSEGARWETSIKVNKKINLSGVLRNRERSLLC